MGTDEPITTFEAWKKLSPEEREFYLYQKVCCVTDHEHRLTRIERYFAPLIAAASLAGAVAYAKVSEWLKL